jgi:hypothetical protein
LPASACAAKIRHSRKVRRMKDFDGWSEDELRAQLQTLREEHRDLDRAIAALEQVGDDQLQITRLKKRKLLIKDEMAQIEDKLLPDIIA